MDDPREPEQDERTPAVVTTEDELRACEIIKEILKDTVADDRVVLQDRTRYCNVVLDGSPTKNIMRMYLHRKKAKIVRLYDDSGKWVQYPVESPEDIFEYADAIRARTMRLLEAG